MARRHGRDAASICLGHFPVGSNHNGLSQLDMRLALTPPRRSGSKATFQERPLLAQSGRSHAKEHPSPVWSLQGRRRESDHRQDAAVDD
jgi:hypothetical protein